MLGWVLLGGHSDDIGLHAAMSPNFCAKISIDESHFPAIVLMQYLDPNGSNSLSEC